MSKHWNPAKKTVELATPVRVSRIRRDPPPPAVKEKTVDPDERDQRTVVLGVFAFALALFVLVLAFGNYVGWSPGDYTVQMEL